MTAGAVLCGGRSRRFGRDKALTAVGGVPMAERVARALESAACDPVVFVGGDAAALAALGRVTVADRWPGQGPLGGMLSAFDALDDDLVVAACDLPHLDAVSVRTLLQAAGGAAGRRPPDAAVARTDRLEPMLAWWSRRAEPVVRRRFADGARAVHDVLAELHAVEIRVPGTALLNVNRPEDLPTGGSGRREVPPG